MSIYNANVAVLHQKEEGGFDVALEMDKVVGNLDDFEVNGQQILVGAFVRPALDTLTTANGVTLWRPPETIGKASSEDAVQSIVCRVLKKGPQAFAKLEGEWPSGAPDVGDWIISPPQNGTPLSVKCTGSIPTAMFRDADGKRIAGNGGWPCRLIDGTGVMGKIKDPWMVVGGA